MQKEMGMLVALKLITTGRERMEISSIPSSDGSAAK